MYSKDGDILIAELRKGYYFLHVLLTVEYKLDMAVGVLDAWLKGRTN